MYRMTGQSAPSHIPATASRATGSRSPFVRLRELIDRFPPGQSAISLAVGEPQHPIPPFVGPIIAAHVAEFGRYPANKGLDEFGVAVAGWLGRRYHLPRPVDPANEVLVLNGTREGLFLAALAAKTWVTPRTGPPAVLIPNPFYAAYAAGAIGADCEPVYLPTTRATGFLPDLDALDDALLARTVAFYIASPANPQGAVADRDYLFRLTALARRFGFLIFADECYCEIYSEEPPAGMLEAAGADFANVAVFHSLSKRSSLPGLRIGFAAGDRSFMQAYLELRNVAAPMVPTPMQHVAIAAYNDENARRGEPAPLSREIRSRRPDHRRPLRLWTPGRRIFPLARRGGARRQRSGGAEALARSRLARGARPLSGARAGRRQQSRRRLYPRRHGAEQRNHRRGAAPPRRGAGLEHDPEKWKPVFGQDHAQTKE